MKEKVKEFFYIPPHILPVFRENMLHTNRVSLIVICVIIFVVELFNIARVLFWSASGLQTVNNRIYFVMYCLLLLVPVSYALLWRSLKKASQKRQWAIQYAMVVFILILNVCLNGYDLLRDPKGQTNIYTTAVLGIAMFIQMTMKYSIVAYSLSYAIFMGLAGSVLDPGDIINLSITTMVALGVSLASCRHAVTKSLVHQCRIQMEKQSSDLLRVQISALKEKMEKVREVEESVRIQRHDMRHVLQTVSELVARGDEQAALDFLYVTEKRLDEQQPIRWCRPLIMDAVFSWYFDQARRQSIPVEAKVSLPDALPVDEGELALVVANALENAIHANEMLPYDERKICCAVLGEPNVMMKVSNPCAGNIQFDSSGLPVSQQEGHGIGVQSISAFCKKNGAVCRFEQKDGWFSVSLVL